MTVSEAGRSNTSTADRSLINAASATDVDRSGSGCTEVNVAGPAVVSDAELTLSTVLGECSPGTSSTSTVSPASRLDVTVISLSSSLATRHNATPESCWRPVSRTPPPANSLACTCSPPRCLELLAITALTIAVEAGSIVRCSCCVVHDQQIQSLFIHSCFFLQKKKKKKKF